MGFLHQGHISLIRQSKLISDVSIISIFVNPTQFGPSEDFESYPRDLEHDIKILEDEGVDFLFLPSKEEIYSINFQTYVNVEHMSKKLEGEFRPVHFRGVTTVVLILFNCINPDFAFFGQKDAQQVAIIKQMIKDLKLSIKIISCPIIREPDGLAMSSRNIYLSDSERRDALALFHSLELARNLIESNERKSAVILSEMNEHIKNVSSANLDYIKIVDADNFELVDNLIEGNEYLILIACKIGKTRLIDNVLIKV